jgi:flagellar motor switch protein FliM
LWTSGADRSQLSIIGHETNPFCLPMTSTSEVFVTLHVEVTLGETKGQLNLGVPFSMVESPVRRIQEAHNHLSDSARPKQMQWRNQYAGIAVPVLAEWKVREMPLSETLRIRTGDIIELPNSMINKASLHLSQVATFDGTVGIQNGNIAVQITGRSNKE